MKYPKAQAIKDLTDVPVRATMIGGVSRDDFDIQLPTLLAQGWRWRDKYEQVLDAPAGNSFIMRPKMARDRVGTLRFRSADYEFRWDDTDTGVTETRGSFGQLTSLKPLPDGSGMFMTMFNGARIEYRAVVGDQVSHLQEAA